MKQFKIRASQGAQILTNPRSKKELYSGTLKSYVQKWYIEQLYERKENIISKYLTKGIQNEDESIEMLSAKTGEFMLKNERYFEDDYFTGTPDVITDEYIIDIKNSWSPFSFPLFTEEIDKAYFIQGQIYMYLTGIKKYKLVYTLTDTPFDLIEREARQFAFKENIDFDDALLKKFIKQMTYGDIDEKLKMKIFEFDYDETVIDELKSKVELCREYLKTILI